MGARSSRAIVVGAALLVCGPLAAGAQGSPAAGLSLAARFRLSLTMGSAPAETSEGALFVFPDGRVCARVERPLRQDLLITRDRVLFHYPDRALVLEAAIRSGQAPPVMETLVAGLGEASQLLPAGVRLETRTREGPLLRTRWTLPSAADGGGTVEVAEAADGMQSFELRDAGGELRRRFDFRGRTRVGRHLVPTSVKGTYRPRRGDARTEEWTLSALGADAPARIAAECAGTATAARREKLEW